MIELHHGGPRPTHVIELMTNATVAVAPDTRAATVLGDIFFSRGRAAVVIDEHDQVLGIVRADRLASVVGMTFPDRLHPSMLALIAERIAGIGMEMLMEPTIPLTTSMSIGKAATAFMATGAPSLPVTDTQGRLIGVICRSDLPWTAHGDAADEQPTVTVLAPARHMPEPVSG